MCCINDEMRCGIILFAIYDALEVRVFPRNIFLSGAVDAVATAAYFCSPSFKL